jgi:hypothetical protein
VHRAVVAAQPRDGVDAGHGVVENNAGDDDVGLGREGQGRLYIRDGNRGEAGVVEILGLHLQPVVTQLLNE